MGRKYWKRRKRHERKRIEKNGGHGRSQSLKALGRMGNEIGIAGEVRVLKACDYQGMPSWWIGARHGTREEDAFEKKDLVVSTDIGEIYIQIKTSLTKDQSVLPPRTEKYSVRIVYVNLKESDLEIRKKVLQAVTEERETALQKKN